MAAQIYYRYAHFPFVATTSFSYFRSVPGIEPLCLYGGMKFFFAAYEAPHKNNAKIMAARTDMGIIRYLFDLRRIQITSLYIFRPYFFII
jgi:hypothetical protein